MDFALTHALRQSAHQGFHCPRIVKQLLLTPSMSGIAQATIKICNDPEIQKTNKLQNTTTYTTNTTQNKIGPARRASRAWRV
jgi:hypothetical protein